MSKPVLFYSAECPDTPSFVAELKALKVNYEEIEVQSSLPNLKRFLRLRDNEAVFDEAKAGGYIGIPFFVLEGGRISLDPKDAGLKNFE